MKNKIATVKNNPAFAGLAGVTLFAATLATAFALVAPSMAHDFSADAAPVVTGTTSLVSVQSGSGGVTLP